MQQKATKRAARSQLWGLFETRRGSGEAFKRVVYTDREGREHVTSAFPKEQAVRFFQNALLNAVFSGEWVAELRPVGHVITTKYLIDRINRQAENAPISAAELGQ